MCAVPLRATSSICCTCEHRSLSAQLTGPATRRAVTAQAARPWRQRRAHCAATAAGPACRHNYTTSSASTHCMQICQLPSQQPQNAGQSTKQCHLLPSALSASASHVRGRMHCCKASTAQGGAARSTANSIAEPDVLFYCAAAPPASTSHQSVSLRRSPLPHCPLLAGCDLGAACR